MPGFGDRVNDPVLVTLTLLLSGIFLAGMLYFDVETSGGAQWDLVKWHYPAIEDFRTKSTLDAIATQRAAGGPLYYIVLSNFDFSQQALRIVSALLLIVSALVFSLAAHGFYGRVAARHDARSRFAEIHLWMTVVFVLNPFILGPMIWAITEMIALPLLALAMLLAIRISNAGLAALGAGVCFSLLCLTRQNAYPMAPLIFLLMVASRGGPGNVWQLGVLFFVPIAASGVFLLAMWQALTPPGFERNSGFVAFNPFVPIGYLGFLIAGYGVFRWCLRVLQGWDRSMFRGSAALAKPQTHLVALAIAALGLLALSFGTPANGGGIFLRVIGFQPLEYPLAFFLIYLGAVFVIEVFCQAWTWMIAVLLYLVPFSVNGDFLYQKYFDPFLFIYLIFGCILFGRVALFRSVLPFYALFTLMLLAFSIVYYAQRSNCAVFEC